MNYYQEIKEQIVNNEINKRVKDYSKNRGDLNTYYNVGKHYGEGIIKEYSKKLTQEFGKGYSQRSLRNMRQLYKVSSELKWQTVTAKITYSHYCEIMWFEKLKYIYYIKKSIEQNLSVSQLRQRIKSNEYERLSLETRNKLISNKESSIKYLIKNLILIRNCNNYEVITEKVLQRLILEDIPSFFKELGNGLTFIENEYKIKIGDRYNYIDLLLYNIKYRCYVVIELKITELKKEHIGQIETYMNYIDKNLKAIDEDKTIGIIIVKKDNKYIMEYCSDERIIAREYELV